MSTQGIETADLDSFDSLRLNLAQILKAFNLSLLAFVSFRIGLCHASNICSGRFALAFLDELCQLANSCLLLESSHGRGWFTLAPLL